MSYLTQHLSRHLALLLALIALCCAPQRVLGADAVTTWSLLVSGNAGEDFDPHITTLMHAAMHDALNAITPRYTRWTPSASGEPPIADAAPEAAVATAAHAVLMSLQPQNAAAIDTALTTALASVPEGPRKVAGVALGKAIAATTLAHRASTGDIRVRPFSQSKQAGHWRATPPDTDARPRLVRFPTFSGVVDLPVPAPPELGSAAYLAAVAEVRSLGRLVSTKRSDAQTAAAFFFAYQSSHLNFIDLAIRLLDARPAPQNIWDSARTMTLLSIVLSDAFILTLEAKERFHFWRPITAIQEGGAGVTREADWAPLVETPQHPDHPSGHAAECAAGAAVLRLLSGTDTRLVRYIATDVPERPAREYPGFSAIADECAASRVWAGVHFRTANDAGLRLGETTAKHVVGRLLQPMSQ